MPNKVQLFLSPFLKKITATAIAAAHDMYMRLVLLDPRRPYPRCLV